MPDIMSSFSEEEQSARTKAILRLLDDWEIVAKDQINLLGLPSSTKARHLQRYHHDETLPNTTEINERIDHLFGIADALRTSYPHNELMGAIWLITAHRRFEKQTPLNTMLEKGMEGLISVRSHLDCAFDWQQDDKNQS